MTSDLSRRLDAGAPRVLHERTRWFSAVLIVAAIAAVSVGLRRLPTPASPRPEPLLALHPMHVFDAPALAPAPTRVLVIDWPPAPAAERATRASGRTVPALGAATQPNPAPAVVDTLATIVGISTRASLPSQRLDQPLVLAAVPPAPRSAVMAAAAVPLAEPGVPAMAADESLALVDIPALALTRAVSVAGRGIRTGLRATTAVFRAAF